MSYCAIGPFLRRPSHVDVEVSLVEPGAWVRGEAQCGPDTPPGGWQMAQITLCMWPAVWVASHSQQSLYARPRRSIVAPNLETPVADSVESRLGARGRHLFHCLMLHERISAVL